MLYLISGTGLGSCIVLILGCVAAARAIIPAKKKPAVAAAGQNTNA